MSTSHTLKNKKIKSKSKSNSHPYLAFHKRKRKKISLTVHHTQQTKKSSLPPTNPQKTTGCHEPGATPYSTLGSTPRPQACEIRACVAHLLHEHTGLVGHFTQSKNSSRVYTLPYPRAAASEKPTDNNGGNFQQRDHLHLNLVDSTSTPLLPLGLRQTLHKRYPNGFSSRAERVPSASITQDPPSSASIELLLQPLHCVFP